jgi:phosphatidylglycerophosphate synthase
VKPPTAWASKGLEVEEWADRRFFRPLGFRVAAALAPTRLSADHVTAASLLLGLVAGHLFVYPAWWWNAAGLALFIGSDLLDSADGQLARMRGSATRWGRLLDGLADHARFLNLYLHLLVRLWRAGWAWEATALVAAAAISHSCQSAAVDFVRNAYLSLGLGRASELDLPERSSPGVPSSPGRRWAQWLYAGYLKRQALLFPQTAALVASLGDRCASLSLALAWRQEQAGVLAAGAWIGQNIRWALLAGTACLGWPAGFFWVTVGPLNAVLAGLVIAHERHALRLGGSLRTVTADA